MTESGGDDRHFGRREGLTLLVAATVWFLPGIWWGLPQITATLQSARWGVDELGPLGAIHAIEAILRTDNALSPQYPLGQYFAQAIFVWPYYLAVRLADNLGFAQQTPSVTILVLLHRLPSLLMAAGTVTAAGAFVRRVTRSRSASWFTAAAVATIGPLLYYARTSNVDAGGLFWATLALVLAADVLQEGLTTGRAVRLGLCAAFGIATKDQQYAYFLGLAAVLGVVHLSALRGAQGDGRRWRAPLLALAVSAASYLLLSGALLLPGWFVGHVKFIRQGGGGELPADILKLVNTYFSNPPTLAGYTKVGTDALTQLLAAVGIPLLGLALLGTLGLTRQNRRLLALLALPCVTLVAGVILPVRFVLPRFLMPIEVVICLLAGIALAEALRFPRWKRAALALGIAGIAWGALRGVDLTWQMHRDSRYDAARWLERNLQPGDTLGYYGAKFKLPALRRDLVVTPAPDQYLPELVYGAQGPVTETPQFILVVPQLISEPVHEWNLPDSVYRGLVDGSRGYDQVLAIQTPAVFPRPLNIAPAVNPPVRLFARRDVASRLTGPPRLELPVQHWELNLAPPPGPGRTVLSGATLIDGTGTPPIAGARIVIEAGHFACVSGPQGCPSLPGDREVALRGKWITPGLIDTHVHLPFTAAPKGLDRLQRLRFALGITTVREAGSRSSIEAALAARSEAENASRPTPRMVVATRIVPEDAERLGVRLGAPLVRRLVALGVEAIKIKEPFEGEIWREEIRAAREAGVPAFGHTWGGPPPVEFTRAAIAEGINGISHLMAFPLASQPAGTKLIPPDSAADPWAWHKHLWLTAQPGVLDTIIGEMIAHQVVLEPTLVTEFYWGRTIEPPREVPFLLPPPRLRDILLRRSPSKAPVVPAYPESWTRQMGFVADFFRRGGVLIAGSDGVRPGLDLHEEMRLIGQAAGSPMAGLLAATKNAAAALGRSDLGTVEVGKLADAVVYPSDPLAAAGATLQVVGVFKGGVAYNADELSAEFRKEYDARVREAWRARLLRGLTLLGGLAVVMAFILILRARRRR